MKIPDQRKSWNREYKRKGKLWRGVAIDRIDEEIVIPALDIGCGNGKDIEFIEGIIGLDFSMNALKLYRDKSKYAVCGDMRNLPFRDSTFNTVLFMHSLDHLLLDDRNIAIREAYRILKREGFMFLKVFSTKDFRYGKGEEIEENTFLRGNGIITHYFVDNELNFESFKLLYKKDIIYSLKIGGEKKIRYEILIKYLRL